MRIVALLDAVSEAVQRSRLIGVAAVDEQSGLVSLQAESKVDVVAVAVGHILETEFVEFVVDVRIGVLKHVLFALENT